MITISFLPCISTTHSDYDSDLAKYFSILCIVHKSIVMARSFQLLSLALSISSVASSVYPRVDLSMPVCRVQTVPTNNPAWNIPTYCDCGGPQSTPLYPTITASDGQPSPTGTQLCAYGASQLAAAETIAPTPFTCNLESATTGFTVPNTWCGCTAGESTSTYSTILNAPPTGTANVPACRFMQDELPAGTISPSAAHCVVASAMPGGTFYDELAWCACGDNAPHPLITGTSVSPSAACDYTTPPVSSMSLAPIASTSCQLSAVYSLPPRSYCGCEGSGTTVRYETQTTGPQPCVFTSVPTATATLPSLLGSNCYGFCYGGGPCDTCDYDGLTIVSRNPEAEAANGRSANASLLFKLQCGKSAYEGNPTYDLVETCSGNSTCLGAVGSPSRFPIICGTS